MVGWLPLSINWVNKTFREYMKHSQPAADRIAYDKNYFSSSAEVSQ